MPADRRPVAYCTSSNRIIDFLRVGECHASAFCRLAKFSSALVVLPFDDAWRRHENAVRTEPAEISEARWHDMLNVLPPVGWHNTAAGESFKLSERITGAIAAIYVRINDRHFTFRDDIRTPHEECCRRVAQSRAYRNAVSPEAADAVVAGTGHSDLDGPLR